MKQAKYILIATALLSVPCKLISQVSDIAAAKLAKERLEQVIDRIVALDDEIKSVYYISAGSFEEYNRRLQKAKLVLDELKDIEKEFGQLSQNNNTEKDYFIKLAYIEISALAIYSRRDEYLGYIKFCQRLEPENYSQYIEQYNKDYSEWESLENKYLSSVRSKIGIIRNFEPDNYDLKVLTAILSYYEKDYTKAMKLLNDMIEIMEEQKSRSATIGETIAIHKKLGFLYSWLAFIQLENNQQEEALATLKKASMFPESESSVAWSNSALKKINLSKTKGYELKTDPVEFPVSNAIWDVMSVGYTFKGTDKSGLRLIYTPKTISCAPMELIKLLDQGLKKLMELENEPYERAYMSLKQSVERHEKTLYKDPLPIFVAIDASNKGYSLSNLELYHKRFNDALLAMNSFCCAYTGWNNLVNNNPNNIYYRIYRIKSNLGIYYLTKNADSFLSFLDYYKINKQRVPDDVMTAVRDLFQRNSIDEISTDIIFLEKYAPDNLMVILTKMEVVMYTESADLALKMIDELESKIDNNAEIAGINPGFYITRYKAHLYFILRYWKDFTTSLQRLKEYSNDEVLSEWIEQMRSRYEFLTKEENFNGK